MNSGETVETPYSWIVAGVALIITSLSFGVATSVAILMKPMSDDLGWTRQAVSLIHALTMLSAGIGSLVIGPIADRRSFGPLSIIGGIATALGLLLASHAHEPWHFYLVYGALVGAIGQGTFFSPITATVSLWFDRNRALAMAIVLCGQSVGGLTLPVILRISAVELGWREAITIYAWVCGIVIVACSLVFLRRPPLPQS